MKIVIQNDGVLCTLDNNNDYTEPHCMFERIVYRFNHKILQYLNYPVEFWGTVRLSSIMMMLKKYPSFYKCFPELKKLVDKYEEVKYKPCNKPKFKYIEFFSYIDTQITIEKIKIDNKLEIEYVPAMIHTDIDIGTKDETICTPSNNLEDILDLPIRLNTQRLPNKINFTLFEFLGILEYSLCKEFKQY